MSKLNRYALCLLLSISAGPLWAEDAPETTEQEKKCDDALAQADKDLQALMYRNQAMMNTSSQQLPPGQTQATTGQQPQSPMAEFLAKMAEGQQKEAELAAELVEKRGEVSDEQLKQLIENKDKNQEFARMITKQKQECITLEFAKKRADRELDRKCEEEARAKAIQRQATVGANTLQSTNAQQSQASLSGTKKRQLSLEAEDLNACLRDCITDKAMNTNELNAKLRNINMEAEQIESERNYNRSKVDLINLQAEDKMNRIDEIAQIKRDALAQANQQNMMALGMALATSQANQNQAVQSAGTATSAQTVLQNFTKIQEICKNPIEQAFDVPADIAPLFVTVNRECRPDASNSRFCVRSNGNQSQDLQRTTTQ